MFCSNCGAALVDGARFCASCGKAVPEMPAPDTAGKGAAPVGEPQPASVPASASGTLPEGMSYDAEGRICWVYTGKKEPFYYYMTEEKVAKLLEVKEIKPASKGKKVALGILDFVDAFGDGDSPYAELPSEMCGASSETRYTPSERPYSFRYTLSVKGDPKHNRIRVWAEGDPEWVYVNNPAQFEFVYHFIASRSPHAKVK